MLTGEKASYHWLLRDKLLAYDIIAADETKLRVLKEVGKSALSLSCFWAQCGGPEEHHLRKIFAELPNTSSLEDIEALLPLMQKPAYDGAD